MRGQPGFWDVDERYVRLSEAGDPLEKLKPGTTRSCGGPLDATEGACRSPRPLWISSAPRSPSARRLGVNHHKRIDLPPSFPPRQIKAASLSVRRRDMFRQFLYAT